MFDVLLVWPAFITSTKLRNVDPDQYRDWWRPLAWSTIPEFIQATQVHSAWPSLRG